MTEKFRQKKFYSLKKETNRFAEKGFFFISTWMHLNYVNNRFIDNKKKVKIATKMSVCFVHVQSPFCYWLDLMLKFQGKKRMKKEKLKRINGFFVRNIFGNFHETNDDQVAFLN